MIMEKILKQQELLLNANLFQREEVEKESVTSSRNKQTNTFYQDYFHCIGNFCAIFLKYILKFI